MSTHTTPVKVPPSAANYTPATLDPDLRSQINTSLIRDGYVTKIQDHVLHKLNAHPSNWPTAIQNHALSLLRSGEITTFPALLRRVLDDVRRDATTTVSAPASSNNKKASAAASAANGTDADAAAPKGLAIPPAVVEEALKITRECLEEIIEVDEE